MRILTNLLFLVVETKQQRINLRRRRLAIHLNLALAYLWQKMLGKAAQQCDVVLEMDPKNQKALLRKGDAVLGMGGICLATILYYKLMEINPEHPDLENRFGMLDKVAFFFRLECLRGEMRYPPQLTWVSIVIFSITLFTDFANISCHEG